MDRNLFLFRFRNITNLFSKGRNPPRPSKSATESIGAITAKIQPVRSYLILIISLLLGLHAHQSTQEETAKELNLKFEPSKKLLTSSLRPSGFKLIKNIRLTHQITRFFPYSIEADNSYWTDKENLIVVFFPSSELSDIPLIFTRLKQSKKKIMAKLRPKNWNHLGRGLEGFQRLQSLLNKIKPVKLSTRKRKSNTWVHPLQLSY